MECLHCLLDLSLQRGNASGFRPQPRPFQGRSGRACSDLPDGYARAHQFVPHPRNTRKLTGINRIEHSFSLIEAADQQKVPCFKVAGVRPIGSIAICVKHRVRFLEHLQGSAQIAQYQRDFCLRDGTTGTG
ncbi:hypothetical protein GCM10011385_33330 [Nitratireductor aestuarii]|uniref:Uncharacterized protein n=1 Tax=Nitratireductor aestuarii TaxID=1735103 RepID=A0A916S0G3_9HYPH|nr:hypothetical protein GCM10011385_33330 [Nitratireductor aestuarii]